MLERVGGSRWRSALKQKQQTSLRHGSEPLIQLGFVPFADGSDKTIVKGPT